MSKFREKLFHGRPWWMTALMLLCALQVFILLPGELFFRPRLFGSDPGARVVALAIERALPDGGLLKRHCSGSRPTRWNQGARADLSYISH